jgi:hypothetical protein
LARSYCKAGIRTLGGLANGKDVAPAIRIQAISLLLDRGYGRPEQPVTGADGGDIRVTIRNIIEEKQRSDK